MSYFCFPISLPPALAGTCLWGMADCYKWGRETFPNSMREIAHRCWCGWERSRFVKIQRSRWACGQGGGGNETTQMCWGLDLPAREPEQGGARSLSAVGSLPPRSGWCLPYLPWQTGVSPLNNTLILQALSVHSLSFSGLFFMHWGVTQWDAIKDNSKFKVRRFSSISF